MNFEMVFFELLPAPLTMSKTSQHPSHHILPLYISGNERDAVNLKLLRDLNITYVLNTTSHIPLYYENQGVTYKRLPASDSGQQNLKQYFEEAFEFIGEYSLLE